MCIGWLGVCEQTRSTQLAGTGPKSEIVLTIAAKGSAWVKASKQSNGTDSTPCPEPFEKLLQEGLEPSTCGS